MTSVSQIVYLPKTESMYAIPQMAYLFNERPGEFQTLWHIPSLGFPFSDTSKHRLETLLALAKLPLNPPFPLWGIFNQGLSLRITPVVHQTKCNLQSIHVKEQFSSLNFILQLATLERNTHTTTQSKVQIQKHLDFA